MSSHSSSTDDEIPTEPPNQIQPNLPPVKLRYIPLPAPIPTRSGTPISITASNDMGLPCRRCLKDAQPGENLTLIAYDPFPANSTSPYRGSGPIFVHTADQKCAVFNGDVLPERQLRRLLSVRAYDERDMMVAAEVVEGVQLKRVAGGMLADKKARYVHVHNAKPGCFAVRIDRA